MLSNRNVSMDLLVWASLTSSRRQKHRLILLSLTLTLPLLPQLVILPLHLHFQNTRIHIQNSLCSLAFISMHARNTTLFPFYLIFLVIHKFMHKHTHTHTFSTFTHWVNTQVNSIPFHSIPWHFPTLKCINYLSENQYILIYQKPSALPPPPKTENPTIKNCVLYIHICMHTVGNTLWI